MTACIYNEAWRGPCGAAAGSSGYCPEHEPLRCRSCGAKATEGCEGGSGGLGCGAPLCPNCGHGYVETGRSYRDHFTGQARPEFESVHKPKAELHGWQRIWRPKPAA
jgi:hypothetical protein